PKREHEEVVALACFTERALRKDSVPGRWAGLEIQVRRHAERPAHEEREKREPRAPVQPPVRQRSQVAESHERDREDGARDRWHHGRTKRERRLPIRVLPEVRELQPHWRLSRPDRREVVPLARNGV